MFDHATKYYDGFKAKYISNCGISEISQLQTYAENTSSKLRNEDEDEKESTVGNLLN